MTTPEFPQFDERTAAGLRGSAAAAGGLAAFLAIEHIEVGPGSLHARVVVRDDLLTPFGNLHGGVLAALCDHVLGTVLYPVIPRGAWAATTEFKINYLAAVTTGALDARARIISLTKRTAVVRIDVENDGRLACAAQGTVLVVAAEAVTQVDASRKIRGMLAPGVRAPELDGVVDQDGVPVELADLRGRWVLLWWYPMADTPG